MAKISKFEGASPCVQSYNFMMEEFGIAEKNSPVIGILGGMGPEATVDLYRHIIELTPAEKDQDHIKALMYSNPKIPDRTEAICFGGEDPLPHLIHSVAFLERAGAGIVAMPCNTAHHYLPAIQSQANIPILNMIEESVRTLRHDFPAIETVGLLAMDGTLKSGVYHRAMESSGVKILLPEAPDQRRIQTAIAWVKAGRCDSATEEIFETAATRLINAGAEAIILGCTEIPLAFDPENVDCPCLNPTRILAQAAVDWALGKRQF
jgi:aspartate racemase